MNIYLDTSALVALFTADPLTGRADAFLRQRAPVLIISDFTAAEFASAVSRRVRMKELSREQARTLFSSFDTWISRETELALTETADIACAAVFLRRLDLALRTPDALHIAIAQRVGADLLTFDQQMAKSAAKLGVRVHAA